MKSKISVIMGIYNCADTLEESLNTLSNQSYTNWELIMCDDGSSDDTLVIADQFAEKHPGKVIVLKNKHNLGLNKTLNKCLKAATGDYIARQDGDDLSKPNRFMKEVKFLDSHQDFAFVSSNMYYFDESGTWGEWKNPKKPTRKDFFRSSPCFCHAPCMIRKEAILAVNGYSVEDKFLRCEDVNLWYKLYEAGYRGYNIQEALYGMRDNRNAYRRRTVKNRINVIRTEYDGMKRLNCHGLEYFFFLKKAFKQISLICMPSFLYDYLHKLRLNK